MRLQLAAGAASSPVLLGALAIASLSACTAESTQVRFRHPADIALRIETPEGTQSLLPSGGEKHEAAVPLTRPPFDGKPFGATALRDEHGVVAIRCDACAEHVNSPLMQPDGSIAFGVAAEEALRWDSDALRVPGAYAYRDPADKTPAGRSAFDFELVTAKGNVLDVRETHTVRRTEAWLLLGLAGVPLTALGLWAFGGLVSTSGDQQRASYTFGTALVLPIGLICSGVATWLLLKEPSTRQVFP